MSASLCENGKKEEYSNKMQKLCVKEIRATK